MTLHDAESRDHEIRHEQAYVSMLYRRIDSLREEAAARLTAVLQEPGGTAQARTERDVVFGEFSRRLAQLDAAENGLCFGRLDLRDGNRRYIGRIGLSSESEEDEPLLLDWRAPAARPFYVATAAAPEGVRRRRQIVTRGRRVVNLDDEALDDREASCGHTLTGEAALLAALDADRTGRMHDIVATLQAEQDAIIRSENRTVLVVQGGPGTGKTAVALHRAAYLLYNRPRLAAQGVLVVGPNATFLSYIEQVLPGLGETSVLLSTVADLFPGVTANRPEPAATSELKGREVMAQVLAAAVEERQAPSAARASLAFGTDTVHLDRDTCARAVAKARSSGLPHNQARRIFRAALIDRLAELLADQTRNLADRLEAEVTDVLAEADVDSVVKHDLATLEGVLENDGPARPWEIVDDEDMRELRRTLASDPDVEAVLEALWPELTPQQLLHDLYADPRRLAACAPRLTEHEKDLLTAPTSGWSAADVPLRDEAAELLGEDDGAGRAAAARERSRHIAFAQEVLDIAAGSMSGPAERSELLTAGDLLDARQLAARHEEVEQGTVAERAAADRTWSFGHVVVDEAQELSPMAWRLLMRRCPSRSMTLVGDVAQTSDASGSTSWDGALRPHVGDRWQLVRLSVNYRTPAEIMAATVTLLAGLDPESPPPESVRRTGVHPWRMSTSARDLPRTLARLAVREAAAPGSARLAVIVPDVRAAELAAAVRTELPGVSAGPHPDLTSREVVLGVKQAKGLEFDSVLIADPAAILTASPRGANDLYVAMTRATQRLGILHPGPAPADVTRAMRVLKNTSTDDV